MHARVRELQPTIAHKAQTYDCNDPNQAPPVGYPCSGTVTASGRLISGGLDLTFDF